MAPHLDVSEAFWGLTDTQQFALIQKTVVDHEVAETNKVVCNFEGVLQPLPKRELTIKPEGQRTWKWWTLWTTQALKLDDMVQDAGGVEYRVMSQGNWNKLGGYFEYDITEGFQE